MTQIRPASAVDYLELRTLGGGGSEGGCVVARAGKKCAGATDPQSCQRRLATLPPAWDLLRNGSFSIFTTAGDHVQTLGVGQDVLVPFLLAIDSEEEAAMVASAAHYALDCTVPMDQVVHAVATGYEVLGYTGTACGPGQDVYLHTLLVSPDGSVTEQKSELIQKTNPNCIVD